MMTRITLLLSVSLVVGGFAIAQDKSIVDTAVAAGQFKTLSAALTSAGLVGTLQGDGPFTVFAPSDAAFAKLPKGTVEALLLPKNKHRLTAILTYHVVSGRVPAAKVTQMSGATTLNGQRVDVKFDGKSVSLDGAHVTTADIHCSNGIIHVIDSVLLPSEKDLVTTAVEAGSFSTLAAALKAGGLIETLQGKGPFTVFAPTDAAFAKLPKETLAHLLRPENRDELVAILTYHVIAGRVYSTDALAAGKAQTLQGSAIHIAVKDGAALVNASRLVSTDLDASNGVIHVIDTVLIPTEESTKVSTAPKCGSSCAKGL